MADVQQPRPAPGGIEEWQGQRVTVHLTGAGRVRSVEGTLAHLGGDGVVVSEDDVDWWLPREHVHAIARKHEQ